ncbi:MAG: hypothetical protein J5582_04755 [Ruminococcus sp.]|uniref:Uncharacterized protein n=1 Tax=Ruminococcus albus TaxID=1264 RepID=A0A1H7I581_RUMAL|nr:MULTISPECIES: hypothetical protein [Ruminococcus]MBO4865862.1 hypothetical protein [Ruminococcus sp.]SEK57588.1 hypothetical protein SAMN05216469_103247 [Ruminococcus albus]
MKVQKVTEKIKLGQENVKAESKDCLHDCAELQYIGKTSTKGCTKRTVYTAKYTNLF